MIEIVLHSLLFLIYIFWQQPDNLHETFSLPDNFNTTIVFMMYKNKIVLMSVTNQNFVFIYIGITIRFSKKKICIDCAFFMKIMY